MIICIDKEEFCYDLFVLKIDNNCSSIDNNNVLNAQRNLYQVCAFNLYKNITIYFILN